ncbi:glucose-methanol-choline oxidoreductase, partial [Tanacetum coccineum]
DKLRSIIGRRFNLDLSGLNGGLILEKVMGPLSLGVLELETVNPEDNPKVTFNYFKDPRDLQTCVQGMETIVKVLESKALSKFRDPLLSVNELLALVVALPLNLRPRHINAPFNLEQYCKDTVMSIWHYHGGCQVDRVVDRNYRVVGVGALRVIDSSTLLNSPGTNPQATMMMLGRYMGVKMLGERLWLLKQTSLDTYNLSRYVLLGHKLISVYIEHEQTSLDTYNLTPIKKCIIGELQDDAPGSRRSVPK